jgi:hypothetical protein
MAHLSSKVQNTGAPDLFCPAHGNKLSCEVKQLHGVAQSLQLHLSDALNVLTLAQKHFSYGLQLEAENSFEILYKLNLKQINFSYHLTFV